MLMDPVGDMPQTLIIGSRFSPYHGPPLSNCFGRPSERTGESCSIYRLTVTPGHAIYASWIGCCRVSHQQATRLNMPVMVVVVSVAACRGSLTVHGAHLICGWYSKIQLYIQRCCHPRFLHGSVRRSVRPLDSLAPCCSTKVQLRISDVLRCKGVINVWKQLGACILCSHNYFVWVSISCLPNQSLSAVHFVI